MHIDVTNISLLVGYTLMTVEFLKEITSKCEGKHETETACLQIARQDGKPVLFSNIEDGLTYSKNSTQE